MKWIEDARKDLPELPEARKKRLVQDYGIAASEVEQLMATPALADYFETVARASADGKAAYNWVMGEVLATLRASGQDLTVFRVRPADLAQLLNLVRDGAVSHTAAKRVFASMVETGKPAAQIAADEGLSQVGDESAIATWVDEVLTEHPEEAKRYLSGEKKLQGVLVGFVTNFFDTLGIGSATVHEKVQRPRGSEARQSVVVFARRIERLRKADGVVQDRSRHAEVVLRLLADVLLAASPQCGAPYLLRFAQRDGAGRIQLERLGVVHSRQQVHHVVECASHVATDFVIAQVPTALLFDEMEDSLPRFRVGDVYHPAKNSSIRRRTEYRRTENAIEVLVAV